MTHRLIKFLKSSIFVLAFVTFACRPLGRQGLLRVTAPTSGTFEIYSIAGDATLQFVSEQVGHYNEDLSLGTGQYLILADCSHQIVTIRPGETTSLIANSIQFIPPLAPKEEDLFSIQCSRYEKANLRQHISNRYTFHVVSGAKDLLVGMVPFKLSAQEDVNFGEAKIIRYSLSAIRVASLLGGLADTSPYFVSPKDGLLSITQAQDFGKWQFLLPGAYQLSLNGTTMDVEVKENEALTIQPAAFRISTSPDIQMSLFEQVRGSPFMIEMNQQHLLNVNTTYPVLPGLAKIRLDGSSRVHSIEFKENQLNELNAKSVRVDLGCSPWEWECLGKRGVSLYLPEQDYPFMDSLTDVPILYLDPVVQVGIEGSPGIRYQLSVDQKDAVLQVGKVAFKPRPIYKPGHLTDLVRLEAVHVPYIGYSYDVVPDHTTNMTLIAGTYTLVRYTSFASQDNDRAFAKQSVQVLPGQQAEIEIPFYLPESKVKALAKSNSVREKRKSKKVAQTSQKHRRAS